MDVAYNQHASHVRRKNRSSTNLNRLTLAPLTSKLPLDDGSIHEEHFPDPFSAPPSYLQGKSAPTTPRLLSRSPGPLTRSGRSRSHNRGSSTPAAIPKSKSTTHLHKSSSTSHGSHHSTHRRKRTGDDGLASARDTDWLFRAGALISTETRESKGQSWLVSRASSVSLAGSDADRAEEETQFARERDVFASRHASRRGSLNGTGDEQVHASSPSASRLGSRSHSRVGSRGFVTPSEQRRSLDGYFGHHNYSHHSHNEEEEDEDQGFVDGPDFVSLDERLEAVEPDTTSEDEAQVRRLVRNGGAGAGTWFGNVLGWGLFSVDENEEEFGEDGESDATEADCESNGGGDSGGLSAKEKGRLTTRQLEGVELPVNERIPPPKADEGGWQDAAWLLSVASKVLL